MARRRKNPFDLHAGSSGGFDLGIPERDFSPKKLTPSQLLQVQAAKKKGHSESFWDRIKHGGGHVLHPVEWTFDKILRVSYGLSEAIAEEHRAQGKGKDFLGQLEAGAHGFAKGFTGKEKHGFGAALPFTHDTPEHHTFLKNHKILRGALGLGADVAFDPVTYLSGGTTLLARDSVHAARIAAGRRAIEDAPGKMLGHVGEAKATKKAVDDFDVLSKGGEEYQFRAALAKEQARHLALAAKKVIEEHDMAQLDSLRGMARAEEKRVEKFLPHFRLSGKQITPTKIAGKQVVPALPKLDDFIARGSVGAKAAQRFRERFVRSSLETPETHAAAIGQRHTQEHLTSQYINEARQVLEGTARHLGADGQRKALHYFERPIKVGGKKIKAIVKQGDARVLNPRYVSHLIETGKISHEQAEFVHNFQILMEKLYDTDKAFGVRVKHFSDSPAGRMYVPHQADFGEGGALNDAMRKLTTKAGFEQKRSHRAFSLHQLVLMDKSGKLPKGVLADPYEVLVGRIRASARRQSELNTLTALAKVAGHPSQVVDSAKLARNVDHQNEINKLVRDLEKGHAKALTEAEAKIRKIQYGKKSKTKAANIGRVRKGVRAMTAAHEKDLKEFNAKLKELQKSEKVLRKGVSNPALRNMSDVYTTALKDEHGHPMVFKGDVGKSVEAVHKVMAGDDAAIAAFDNGWRKWVAKWKILVTTINPGYRVRNTTSDAWAMYISGANAYEMGKYSLRAGQVMIGAKKGEPWALHIVEQAYRHGVLSGLYQGDIQQVKNFLKYSGSKKSLFKRGKGLQLFTKVAQDMNRNAENFGRMAHLMWQIEGEGKGWADAAFRVKRAHFDYEDLTTFEQRKMKAVIPFYTWTRKNIPFQIKALVEKPGKYAAFPKAVMESEEAAGGDKGTIIPDYIPQAFGFQVPFGKHNYLLPQIGAADLQALDSLEGAKQRAEGLINPGIRVPLELMANKNLYTGADIASDSHTRSPVSPIGARLLSLLPGSDVGQTSRVGPGGDVLSGPGANPYVVHAAGNLGPLAGLIMRSGGIKRKQTPINPLWSYAAGLSVQHVDPEQQEMFAELEMNDAAKKMMARLREEGLVPPARRRKSKVRRRVNRERGRG